MSDRHTEAEKIARFDRIMDELDRQRAEKLKHEGKCRCGVRLADCAPERCSHSFARDALWGNT